MKIRDSAVLLLSLGLAFAPLRVSAQAAAAPAGDEKAANLKRAEELYRNGERLYPEGSYESAILAFQESYELSKEPQLLYNIGNAYERLGDFANSRRYLDQYRAFAPEKEREALSRRIQALDQRQREKEQKEREAAAANQNNPQNNPQSNPQTTPATTQPKVDNPPPPKKERIYGPAAIALTAGVVVGLGLLVGFGLKANSQKKSALDQCMDAGDGRFCSDAGQAALDGRKTSALVADIGIAVAAASAIGLVTVIALKARKKPADQKRALLAPYAGPRGAGLNFNLRF
jgi:tetratricopeptide (TPR) repeat protein